MRKWLLRADVLMVLASAPAYVATREALSVFAPQDLTPLRYLASAAVLGLYLVVRRQGLRLTRRDLPRMLAVALCGYGGYGLLLNFGQATVPAGTTSLLLNISPVFAFVLGYFILVERTTLRGYLGMGVAVLGVVVITLGDSTATGFEGNTLLIVAAALLLSIFLIVQQPLLARVPPVEVVFWGCLVGGLATLPTARFEALPAHVPASVWLALVVLVVLGTAVAYSLWNVTLARTSVAEGGSLLLVIPIFSVLLGWVLLGEVPSLGAMVGGAAALMGVTMLSTATHARAQAGPGLLTGAIPIIAALPLVSVLTGSIAITTPPLKEAEDAPSTAHAKADQG
ncbi:DMT family transporter [Cryobacterium frigoriphilum]|uniref:DMT family transporter n=1 Tax=Cryobacterium frigoriphilum TaxID=1259150 RepID=A0A4R9A822_9MICO|nr:DMT family transporter [Cryobacterium frigoriphilum]TFD53992.1 DMT family transporter [Cryobacterium frigoriphilum]